MNRSVDIPALLDRLGIGPMEKRGFELWSICPMPEHNDKHPSWSIVSNPGAEKHGKWWCRSCESGGGPIRLAAIVLDVTNAEARAFVEGLEFIDERRNRIDVVQIQPPRVFRMPAEFKNGPLPTWPWPMLDYLSRRGITDDQIRRWQIGYAVGGRLDMRVVFPIDNEFGKPGGYDARTIIDDRIRYLTPHKEEGIDPNAIFGRRHWPLMKERKTVVVTEGTVDALACERAGAPAIAAVRGSNLDPGKVAHLATFTEVVIVSDADKAGDKLAAQVAAILGRWCFVRRARPPEGFDAAKMSEDGLRLLLIPPQGGTIKVGADSGFQGSHQPRRYRPAPRGDSRRGREPQVVS